ncbi:AAA family ATPase [Mycolicibacillus trivialis]|uniref:Uncharacterized protein n=1 Tax=Mycolicibacillus trivialis TaxID=1798 RepID=A0A1X2EPR8_9MYCO|nr:AAA family ATPase [Mycolicibacillus trivialis]ORX08075.1 hypothetical protein AWC30_03975 [Mycolicibacillus trivialis]
MTSLEDFEAQWADAPLPEPEDQLCHGVTQFRTWLPADLTDVLDGTWKPAEPTVGRRDDGVGLFYPGKQHTVASESEAGKTWFVLTAARDELSRDRHVVYLDFEDDRGPVVGRLLALGTNPDRIREYFHYVRPESPLNTPANTIDLDATLARYGPSLAVLDGVTEAMVLHGLNPSDNADAATFGRMVPRRLAQSGAATVSLDHVTKSTESRGRYSIGAVHKLNGLDGAAYVLDNRRPFGIGVEGVSTVRIAKDRPGQLRRHALPGGGGMFWFADLVLDATMAEGHTEALVRAPEEHSGTEAPPTHMMRRVADELGRHSAGLSQRVLCDVVKGKAVTIRLALSHLIAGGYVTSKTPHQLLKPFSERGGEK